MYCTGTYLDPLGVFREASSTSLVSDQIPARPKLQSATPGAQMSVCKEGNYASAKKGSHSLIKILGHNRDFYIVTTRSVNVTY